MEYVYVSLLFVIVSVSGCRDFSHKPWVRQPTDPDDVKYGMRIHYSDRVLFATVKELIPDPVHKKAGVQAANVDVICIYKGGKVPERITIIGAGNKNGEIAGCPSAELEVNRAYVFFLNNKMTNYHEIEFGPLGGDVAVLLDDLTIYCGTQLEFPIGLPVNEECFEPLEEEYCERYNEPTVPPTNTTTMKPEEPKKNNPGNHGDDSGKEIKPEDEEGYETNPGESKTQGGKASGSTNDNKNKSSGLIASLTLLIVPLIFSLL